MKLKKKVIYILITVIFLFSCIIGFNVLKKDNIKISNIFSKYNKYESVTIKNLSDFATTTYKVGKHSYTKYIKKDGSSLPSFEMAYDNDGKLTFLVEGIIWDLDEDADSIVGRLGITSGEYSWANYYKNSKQLEIEYGSYENFDIGLKSFIKNACEAKKQYFSADGITSFNNNYCVTSGIVLPISTGSCFDNNKMTNAITFKAYSTEMKKNVDYTFKYFYNNGESLIIWDDGNCLSERNIFVPDDIYDMVIADDKEKVCNWLNGLYQDGLLDAGDYERALDVCSSYITKKKNSSCSEKSSGHFVNVDNIRVNKCVSTVVPSLKNKSCIYQVTDSAITDELSITHVDNGYTYTFKYSYNSDGSLILLENDNACYDDTDRWVANDIYNIAANEEDKKKVCNWFKTLYRNGFLSNYDFNAIPSECNINIVSSGKCKMKNEGHYVDKDNFRVTYCSFSNTIESCSSNVLQTIVTTKESEDGYYYDYIAGYNLSMSSYGAPVFIRGKCDSDSDVWSAEDLLINHNESACTFIQDLAYKGVLSSDMIASVEKYNATKRGVDDSLVCELDIDEDHDCDTLDLGDGNSVHINDGQWISEADFTKLCERTVYSCDSADYSMISKNNPTYIDLNYILDYSISYKVRHKGADGSVGPAFIASTTEDNKCDNVYDAVGIAKQFAEGCTFIQQLAADGVLTDTMVKEVNNSELCGEVTVLDKECNSFLTEKGNMVYSVDGYYVEKATYDSECNTEEMAEEGGYSADIEGTNKKFVTSCVSNSDNIALYSGVVENKQILQNKKYTYKTNKDNFEINKYCSVECDEEFFHYYPGIFQATKSGTYFEFMYNPEVKGKRNCTLTYQYYNASKSKLSWKRDYVNAINKELKAYYSWLVKYLKWESWDYAVLEDCSTEKTSKTRYLVTYTNFYYDYDKGADGIYTNFRINSSDVISKRCRKKDPTNVVSDSSLKNLKTKMEKAVDARITLEENNRQCHYALANTSNEENAVFLPNLTEGVTSNKDVKTNTIDEHSTESACSVSRECTKEPKKTNGKVTNEFYLIKPEVSFKYTNKDKEVIVDKLSIKNMSVKDTAAYTKNSSDYDDFEKFEFTIHSYDEDGNVDDEYDIGFNAYTATTINREVDRYYIYEPSKDYYIDYTNSSEGEYTSTCTGSKCYYLGKVYPIELANNGKRDVYFALSGTLGHKNSFEDIEGELSEDKNDGKFYRCEYQIYNEVVLKDETYLESQYGSIGGDFENPYKANFYVRSIATDNVDPNNRMSEGTLGANWASDKGQALIDIIEKKDDKKNTYNPNNLEYSFTLDPLTIDLIRKYNDYDSHKYYEFNMKCNDMGGECKSEFLDELAGNNPSHKTRVNGEEVKNVNAVMKRKNWKYYINGSWWMTDKLTSSKWWSVDENNRLIEYTNNYCDGKNAQECYDSLYREVNEGVLP